MKTIPGLMSCTAESDIFQRRTSQVSVDPKGKDPLFGATKLSRAGEHAAPVDPDREFEGFTVFKRDAFRGQLRASVEGKRWRRWKILRDAVGACPAGKQTIVIGFKSIALWHDRNIRQRPDRIDTARAQQNESGAVPLGQF